MTKKSNKHPNSGTTPTKLPQEYQLRIPSQTDNLELIRGFVSKIAEKIGFGEEDISKIELATDEACSNVMKHAYQEQNTKKWLDILVKLDIEKLTIIVTDHGKGFDPQKVKVPDMKEYLAQLKVGGLGIYLMRTLMDEVDYNIHPGVKNQVKMVKYLVEPTNSKILGS